MLQSAVSYLVLLFEKCQSPCFEITQERNHTNVKQCSLCIKFLWWFILFWLLPAAQGGYFGYNKILRFWLCKCRLFLLCHGQNRVCACGVNWSTCDIWTKNKCKSCRAHVEGKTPSTCALQLLLKGSMTLSQIGKVIISISLIAKRQFNDNVIEEWLLHFSFLRLTKLHFVYSLYADLTSHIKCVDMLIFYRGWSTQHVDTLIINSSRCFFHFYITRSCEEARHDFLFFHFKINILFWLIFKYLHLVQLISASQGSIIQSSKCGWNNLSVPLAPN